MIIHGMEMEWTTVYASEWPAEKSDGNTIVLMSKSCRKLQNKIFPLYNILP